MLATLLPGIIGAAALFIYQYRDGRTQLEKHTVQTARALVQAIDNKIFKIQALAQGLASISGLAQGDLSGFHEQARETLKQSNLGLAVILYDATGQQVLNTLKTFGEPLPRSGAPELSRRVFETGKPAISNLFWGATTNRLIMLVGVPVTINGKVAFTLAIPVLPSEFNDILAEQQLPPDWVATVLDGAATIVARTQANDEFLGKKSRQDYVDRFLTFNEEVAESTTLEGIPSLTTVVRSGQTGWGIAIGFPLATSHVPLVRHLVVLAAGLAVLFAVGLGLAWRIGDKIARSFLGIVAQASALGAGQPVSLPAVGVREAEEAARAIGEAAELLKEREKALCESEERFRLIADNIPHLAWMGDSNAYVFWNNQRCLEFTGLSAEELLGHGWMQVCHPDHLERVLATAKRCFESAEPYEETFPARCADGEYRWLLSRAVPKRDSSGRVVCWFGTNTDITERKLAEEGRRRVETRLQRLYDVNLVGIVVSDEGGYAIEANDHFLQIIGRSRQELESGALNWRDITPPEWVASAERAWAELWKQGSCSPFETEYVRPDGSRRPVSLTAASLPEEPGKTIVLVQDISERKRAEKEIEDLNAALERRVEERTEALMAANRELEAFTFATSHDLKGPLGRINSFGTLLEQRYRDKLEGDGLLYLEFIRQNSIRLNQLVDDLLHHARIAHQDLELKPVDLLTRVLVVMEGMTEDISDTKADVRINIPPVRVLADPQALTQVLFNLLQNALKYSAASSPPMIEICGEERGGSLVVWVQDNGIGFDMAYHDKIFEIFRRLHTYNEYEGSGVGLALVKRAMERMGGRVWAVSEPGQGSTFFLELKMASADMPVAL